MNTKQSEARRDCRPEDFFGGRDLTIAQAIYKEDTKNIERLISQEHYDVNGRGYYIDPDPAQQTFNPVQYTYLGYAVLVGSIKAAEKLLQLEADINLVSRTGGATIYPNINTACDNKNWDMIRLLVRYKANLNPPLSSSPIDDLLMGNVDKEMIDFLLANGANINHQEYIGGEGALESAIQVEKFDCVNYFLNKGADPLLLDNSGNNLASLVEGKINEGRLSDYGLKEYNQLKNRLTNEFHIRFPLEPSSKIRWQKGRAMAISRYENLSPADKDFLGQSEADRIQKWKDGLEKSLKENAH